MPTDENDPFPPTVSPLPFRGEAHPSMNHDDDFLRRPESQRTTTPAPSPDNYPSVAMMVRHGYGDW